MLAKNVLAILLLCFIHGTLLCREPQKRFDPDSLSENYFNELRKEFGVNKQYPSRFEKQILIALSYYPELKYTPILFRARNRHSIALTRATWGGVFKVTSRRDYVITISDSTEPVLMPILFEKQSFNAQIGIIGHELGHVVQYSRMSTLQLMQYVFSNISARYIDRFEYQADGICIAHGLGYQLLDWSSFIRKTMNIESWRGPDYVHRPNTRERYMNPTAILNKIAGDSLYKTIH